MKDASAAQEAKPAPIEFPELTEELEYQSKIDDDLEVMGTEDMENFERVRRETTMTMIGTHSDSFHCDEVLATAMLL